VKKMNPTTYDTVVLTYATSRGDQKVVRLVDARPDIGRPHVQQAADSIRVANIFDETVGSLTSLVSAVIVSETVTQIIPAA
jgi:hypothetical protein